MPLSNDELLAALKRFDAQQIQLAGQRYTPGVELGAPNLKIESLLTAVESVGCGQAARERFSRFTVALIEGWSRAKYSCEKRDNIQLAIDALEPLLNVVLPRIYAQDTTALDEWKAHLTSITNDLEAELKRWRDEDEKVIARESLEKGGNRHAYSSSRSTIQSHIGDII